MSEKKAPSSSNIPFSEQFKRYNFELKHLLVIFVILISFLLIISFIQKVSLQSLLLKTQDWYQQDYAERLANLTATSLELLLEKSAYPKAEQGNRTEDMVEAFNIILSQQVLQAHVDEVAILVTIDGEPVIIRDGRLLYEHFLGNGQIEAASDSESIETIQRYRAIEQHLRLYEEIYTIREESIFHVFVPFVPTGEFAGAVYVKNTPDFSFITREIIANYDETALIFAALILFGLMAVFYISSYSVKERDEARELFFNQRENFLTEKIEHEKEALFTRRIYHAHHKAEKVMGFIKQDLRQSANGDSEDIRQRILKYANFVSRVIYDMKWYDPPLQTIRNQIFRTNLNEVVQFMVEHIFMRTSMAGQHPDFELDLDEKIPVVPINEFVVWEILEPLIQNSIDHSQAEALKIRIHTEYQEAENQILLTIEDNGIGLSDEMLMANEDKQKLLFLEHVSSRSLERNSGYGCYLAYQISRRCGWALDAENNPNGGCKMLLRIPA